MVGLGSEVVGKFLGHEGRVLLSAVSVLKKASERSLAPSIMEDTARGRQV